MAKEQPPTVAQTKPNNEGSKDVKVQVKRKVTYIFKATSSSNLNIPYAVAINGTAKDAFKDKPKRVSGNSGKIIVEDVDPGAKVSLYLNSDAHPSYRKMAVYEVTPNDRDVIVKVTEKKGPHSDADTPVQVKDKDAKAEAAKAADTYTAPLTGDIWMKVSHLYTSAEVDDLMPSGTSAEVVTAIKSIYDVLTKESLTITGVAAAGKAAPTVKVKFEDSNNPKANIVKGNYELLKHGLTRVHPGGYAALFNAALENNIAALTVTSCWRPMLGSIAHRSGLGLDVNYVGSTKMNRRELREGKTFDTPNVSDEEVKLFKVYETTKPAKEKAEAKVAWEAERDANEPAEVKNYRASLLRCSCVKQLFDPWFMEGDTDDGVDPVPNLQRGDSTSNERLHAHHLHVTVKEPKIL